MLLRRLGRVFGTEQFADFSSHAQVPTAYVLGDKVRVYFAARNGKGKSFTAYADFDSNNPTKLLKTFKDTVLSQGKPGTFDEDGNMPSQVVTDGKRLLMYYSGWNAKISTPYHNSTGLAESLDNGDSFQRVYEGPVMERTPTEPYVAVTPSVIRDGNLLRCWYVSGLRWILVSEKYEPVYVIKAATSEDGINWTRDGMQAIPSRFNDEAFSRPTVFKKGGTYHMLFCARGSVDYRDGKNGYKFGYATSTDGVKWQRRDEDVRMEGTAGEWESIMNCYPFHVEIGGKDFIFYNGNGFGQTGFGLAEVIV